MSKEDAIHPWPKGDWVRRAATITCVFTVLCLSVDAVGLLSPVASRTLVLVLLFVLAGLLADRRRNDAALLAVGWVGAAALAVASRDIAFWLLGYSGFLALLAVHAGARAPELPALARAAVVVSILFGSYLHVPAVWTTVQEFSVWASHSLARVSGVELRLGAEASGLLPAIVCSCIALSFLRDASDALGRLTALAVAAAAPVLLLGYLLLGVLYSPTLASGVFSWLQGTKLGVAKPDPAALVLHAPFALMLVLAAVSGLLLSRVALASAARVRRARLQRLTFALGLGLSGALAAILAYHPASQPVAGAQVLFHNRGMIDWQQPNAQAYGLQRLGMFGQLPKYLRAAGFEAKVMPEKARLSTTALRDVDVLTIINPTERFSAEERRAVWDFVAAGGGLLVLGDHTDLGGMKGPLDELLHPVHIAFAFDSAFTLRHWEADYRFVPHPMTRRLDWSNEDLQHSTGASLRLGSGARPIVTLRSGFSDKGVRENEANGFLGDYRYQIDEQLSGLTVVAEARYGAGRVVAFGDTSAFQNVAIAHSAPFLSDVFAYLADRSARPRSAREGAIYALLFALSLCIAFVQRSRPRGLSLCAMFGATTAAVVAVALDTKLLFPFAGGELALIDAAHANRFSLKHWEPDSLGGLSANLARAGFLPVFADARDFAALSRARLLLSVAPGKPYSHRELESVRAFMQRGGYVVLAAGYEEQNGALGLLEAAGASIAPIPLGPIPVRKKTLDPAEIQAMQRSTHFREAWPIQARPELEEVYFRAETRDPVAGMRKVGEGGLVIVADSQFLHDRTLEEENAWWLGNIRFVGALFERLRKPLEAAR